MKCFISGITGFVGPHLARYLVSQGMEVLGVGRRPAHPEEAYEVVECDLLDFDRLRSLVAGFHPDALFHLAACSNPVRSSSRPRHYYLVNVQGTVNLLEAVRLHCREARLLLVSSGEVYGRIEDGVRVGENAPLRPLNPYASSKAAAEEVGRQYQRTLGCSVVIVRPFNHSGPGQGADFVISDFCRQIALLEMETPPGETTPIVLRVGNLEPVRDFLDVRDVVRAYAGLALEGRPGETYNVCSGRETSIRQVAEHVCSLARRPARVEVAPERFRSSHSAWVVGDGSKLRSILNWSPRHRLEETIADTLAGWRSCLSNRAG